jgi:amidase
VTDALAPARTVLSDVGFLVDDASPDMRGAEEAFTVLRGFVYAREFAEALRRDPAAYKQAIHDNTEYGLSLTTDQVGRAIETRTRVLRRVVRFLDDHRFLALPTVAVPPFPVSVEYPTEIAGTPMRDYTSWFATCSMIALTGLPAISVPAGFTDDGLPVGLQIVGRPKADVDVLRAAFAFQQATMLWHRHPPSAPAGA